MLSTMHDIPLSIARILTYGSQIHGNTTVTSCDNGSKETATFAEIGARAAALAHALRSELNVTDDQRVGTFMYNCAEHLESFFAVTCMGAVFNPLNKQLMDDQLQHIINHAEDQVIIADPRLAHKLSAILEHCPGVRFLGCRHHYPSRRCGWVLL